MTNSATGHVVKYLKAKNPLSDNSGFLIIEQGARRNKSTVIAFRCYNDAAKLAQDLQPRDYVQVTFKLQSSVRQSRDGDEYWVSNVYLKDVIKL